MSAREISDAEALRRIRSNPGAICAVYDRHVHRLVAALSRRNANPELAFEIAQETFARLLERGHRVQIAEDGSAWPWLWTVACNLMVDHQRSGTVDAHARKRLGIATVRLSADEVDDVIDRLDAAEMGGSLARAIDALSPEQREALSGRLGQDLTYRELAELTGATEQVLRARVSRGLRTLRVKLLGGES